MKLSEAIFIFERYEGGSPLLSSFDEFDRFEIVAYLLKSKNEVFKSEDINRAQMLFSVKLAEYAKEIERSNRFMELLEIENDGDPVEEIEGMNKTLKYLTELSLYLASIGVNYQEVTVYEAHRLYAISYKARPKKDNN
jgi:hypothetical protein